VAKAELYHKVACVGFVVDKMDSVRRCNFEYFSVLRPVVFICAVFYRFVIDKQDAARRCNFEYFVFSGQ
jgi:hypothetical protein